MIKYIHDNCVLPALDKPIYDKDSDTYDLYYEEASTTSCPYDLAMFPKVFGQLAFGLTVITERAYALFATTV